MLKFSTAAYQQYLNVSWEIDELIEKLVDETAIFSSPTKYYEHPSFKTLVGMGDKIVPYLIYTATQEIGWSWVIMYLLTEITKTQPIKPENAGKFYLAIVDWLNWYNESPYANHNRYMGLVEECPRNRCDYAGSEECLCKMVRTDE